MPVRGETTSPQAHARIPPLCGKKIRKSQACSLTFCMCDARIADTRR